MRNIKLTLAYDGTTYHGWQVQPGVATVQGDLNSALSRLLDHDVATHGSGRTDAGVHAHGQVANFRTERVMDLDALMRGANALLPPAIRVMGVEEVSLDFHSRISARAKTYEYHLWRDIVVPPFHRNYVHASWQPLNADAMDRAAEEFVGVHDFTSFSATSAETDDRVREVFDAGWERDPGEWVFTIRANGFLQYMVRTIVGTLIEVGREKIAPEEIAGIFEAKDRRRAGPSAPPGGLHLIAVEYDGELRGGGPDVLPDRGGREVGRKG
jgi:tRNA pseudouridine38-40 synthase